ncbi:UNVERIFIED_CONTAM: Bet1-like SNARE 1-1 [Sesamum latifolium]|uniref:Bet1-like SNARE 1-1 n=1 Tax=Sesamum latifolium TaxID=2727402 RepID=A0AAW2U1L6_9LAMI
MSYSFRDRNARTALFDGIEEGGIRASSSYSTHEIDEQENDRAIDGLQDRVNLLKRISGDIHEEVESHNHMLDRMGNDMDASRGVLSGTMDKFKMIVLISEIKRLYALESTARASQNLPIFIWLSLLVPLVSFQPISCAFVEGITGKNHDIGQSSRRKHCIILLPQRNCKQYHPYHPYKRRIRELRERQKLTLAPLMITSTEVTEFKVNKHTTPPPVSNVKT